MSIAKGRTNCEAERDVIVQGFNDLLQVLKQAKNLKEIGIKSELYDIITNQSISEEEKYTQKKPFYDLLSESEETNIRIRRTILIGLFSFWELSLKGICDYYHIDVEATKLNNTQKKKQSKDKTPRLSENDYLNAIFQAERPKEVGFISSTIKELRNYMTHGSADDDRKAVIDSLTSSHPEFCVSKTQDDYVIDSYDGLDHILNIIIEGLCSVEATAKAIHGQNKTNNIL